MKRSSRARTLALPILLAATAAAIDTGAAQAEVKTRNASGFELRFAVEVAAKPADAYRIAVRDIGRWWDKDHTYSGRSANLSLDPKPGGCLCERLDGGGGVQHLEVVYVQPGQTLRLMGGLGPLQELAAQGVLTWSFKALDDGRRTRLGWTYKVTGLDAASAEALAPLVDQVVGTQLARLGRFVETGKP